MTNTPTRGSLLRKIERLEKQIQLLETMRSIDAKSWRDIAIRCADAEVRVRWALSILHPKAAAAARAFVPGPKITIQRAWQRARDKAGFADVHFHDLRHSAASAMASAGIDLYTVGKVLGHRDPRSTARYAHHYTDTLAAAVATIGQKSPHQTKKRAA